MAQAKELLCNTNKYVKEIVMSYILTYKKIEFYPLDPKTEDIDIEDIAHALSLLARADTLASMSATLCLLALFLKNPSIFRRL